MAQDSVTVIIRSVGERTSRLCGSLVFDQGVPASAIHTVSEVPFSSAMKKGFEVGIAQKRPWTCCIDADLLLRPGAISRLIDHAEAQPLHVCEVQGFVLDKFFGGIRMGGVHLYRTGLLPKMIESIPPEGESIRPESFALRLMAERGHPAVTVREVVGLHDFEQWYVDIYRKCFVQAHKHFKHAVFFVPFWRKMAEKDLDYRVALSGFSSGIQYGGNVNIDAEAGYYSCDLEKIGVREKTELDCSFWNLERVEESIKKWRSPKEYWRSFPLGLHSSNDGPVRKIISAISNQRADRGIFSAGCLLAGLALMKLSEKDTPQEQ